MRLQKSLVILAGAALLAGLFGPATASAADPRFKTDVPAKPAATGVVPSLSQVRNSTKPVTVVLTVAGKPVGVVAAEAAALGRPMTDAQKAALRTQYKSAQSALFPAIRTAGGTVNAQLTDALNGIKVTAKGVDVGKLAKIAGVTAVLPVRMYTADNISGVPYVQAPAVWGVNGVNGATGKGVKVAIIDSGIDYTHANFGGPGTVAAYEFARNWNPPVVNKYFPSGKVAGGWDFAGDAYNPDSDSPIPPGEIGSYSPDPQPDGNPIDCYSETKYGYPGNPGHGSHVAGSTAGFGVLKNGATFSGPYNTDTYVQNSFRIGPGTAPQATLYALRVFGCYGSTNLVVEAIDWAVANNMNVINMSLGSPYGSSLDADAVAVDNASLAGVTVVMSAGNNGPVLGITGSPGVATRGISVAANDPMAVIAQGVVTWPQPSTAPGTVPAAEPAAQPAADPAAAPAADPAADPIVKPSPSPQPSPTPAPSVVPGPGKPAPDAVTNIAGITVQVNNDVPIPAGGITAPLFIAGSTTGPQGCVPADFVGSAGKIVVAVRGVCDRVERAKQAQAAGAVAAILVNNASGFPPFEGPIPGVTTVPFLGAAGGTYATFLAHAGQMTTITNTGVVPNPGFGSMASFSSSGPRNNDSWIKPDVTAPGVGIFSTWAGTGNLGETLSGTSMASPMVAGIAALVKQKHNTWGPEQIKGAIVGTSNSGAVPSYTLLRSGAGLVNADAAARTASVLIGDPGTASLSYGINEFTAASNRSVTKTLRLVTSNTKAVYNLSAAVTRNMGVPGVSVSVSPSQVLVGPNTPATISVTLTLSPGSIPSFPVWGAYFVSGEVVATPVTTAPEINQPVLRAPFMIAPKGASSISSTLAAGTIRATNSGAHTGTIDQYTLGAADATGETTVSTDADIRAFGAQTYDYWSYGGDVLFAINMQNRLGSPSTNVYDILIDVNRDGDYTDGVDRDVLLADYGLMFNDADDGRFASFVFDGAGNFIDWWWVLTTFNSSNLIAPIPTVELGINPGTPRFSYMVTSYSRITGLRDQTPVGYYNYLTPTTSSGGFANIPVGGSATIPGTFNAAENAFTPSAGWLLMYEDNATGASQAQILNR